MGRNYQTPIFTEVDLEEVEYIPESDFSKRKLANIYTPRGDREVNRACVVGLYGGGGDMFSLRQWANDFTSRGYVFCVPTYRDSVGDFDEAEQILAVIYDACFNRYLHKNHNKFGIKGSKFFGMGVSAGGLTTWQNNVALHKIFTDVRFASPVNDLYKNAKMVIKGSASMPGGCSPLFSRLISAEAKSHQDHHGTFDPIFLIQPAKDAIAAMNGVGVRSDLHEYNANHAIAQFHDLILDRTLKHFATLLGIPIVPEIIPT